MPVTSPLDSPTPRPSPDSSGSEDEEEGNAIDKPELLDDNPFDDDPTLAQVAEDDLVTNATDASDKGRGKVGRKNLFSGHKDKYMRSHFADWHACRDRKSKTEMTHLYRTIVNGFLSKWGVDLPIGVDAVPKPDGYKWPEPVNDLEVQRHAAFREMLRGVRSPILTRLRSPY
jgi:hypothetical protein